MVEKYDRIWSNSRRASRRGNKRRRMITLRWREAVSALRPRLKSAWRLWPGLIVIALLAALGHNFHGAERYRVRHIRVPVCQHLTRDNLLNYLHARPGQNIFSVDLGKAARHLVQHPWIKSAIVRRQLPDTLVLEVTERTAVALLQAERLYLVDADGVPFKRLEKGDNGDLPLLTGFDLAVFNQGGSAAQRQAELMAEAARLFAACTARHILEPGSISEIRYDLGAGYSLITTESGIKVCFGFGDYEKKLNRFAAVARHLPYSLREAGLVDLSVAGQVVVRKSRKGTNA